MKRFIFPVIAMILGMTIWAAATGAGSSPVSSSPVPPTANLQSDLPDGIGAATVDVAQLTASPLWGSLTASDKPVRAIQSLQNRLIDIGLKLTDLTQVAACVSSPGTNGLVIAVTGTINSDSVLAKLRSNPDVKITSETYKNTQIYTAAISNKAHSRTQNISFAFVGSATAVLGSAKGVHGAIDAAKGDQPSLAQNSKVQAGLGEAPSGPIRFAIVPPPGLASQLESSSIPLPDFSTVSLVFGAVGVNSGIDLNVTLRHDTANHATAMASQLNSLLSMARGMLGSGTNPKNQVILDAVKTVAISANNTDVKITGNVSQDLISKVFH